MAIWKLGIAFVHGLNAYGKKTISSAKMKSILAKINSDDMGFVDLVRADNVIFRKKGIDYAEVGVKIEKLLKKFFKEKVIVTTRSLETFVSINKKLRRVKSQTSIAESIE